MDNNERRRRGFLWITSIFSVFSIAMIFTAWYASGITPALMQRNYRSVQYAAQMETALVSIFLESVDGKVASPDSVTRFDDNLLLAEKNETEVNEDQILQTLRAKWTAFRAKPVSPSVASFKEVATAIDALVEVNEKAMHAFEERATSLRYSVIAGSVLGFILVLLYAWQAAEWHRPHP